MEIIYSSPGLSFSILLAHFCGFLSIISSDRSIFVKILDLKIICVLVNIHQVSRISF